MLVVNYCKQIMIINGVALLGLTLKCPPYFGPGGSTESMTLMQSSANRLRCALDLAVLWVYVCSLVATLLYTGDTSGDGAHQWSLRLLMNQLLLRVFLANGSFIAH